MRRPKLEKLRSVSSSGYPPSVTVREIAERIRIYKFKRIRGEGLVESAVLVPVVEENGSLIFIRRSMNVKDHKGQIAFPGGVVDRGDSSPLETALREAHEELGIDPRCVEFVNFLDDTVSIAGYLIHPVVGLIRRLEGISPNRVEVDDVYVIPISDIMSSKILEDPESMILEFHVGDIVIWGATARILKNFLEVSGLLSPTSFAS